MVRRMFVGVARTRRHNGGSGLKLAWIRGLLTMEGAVFLRMPKIMEAAFRQPPDASNIQYANTAL